MTDETKKKRGPGRPPKATNKFNLSKFKSEMPEITEVGDLIRASTTMAIQELIKMAMAYDEYKDASCTNRLGANKELLALGLKFLEDDIVKILEQGAAKEKEAEEAAKAEEEDVDTKKSDNIFQLKTFKGS